MLPLRFPATLREMEQLLRGEITVKQYAAAVRKFTAEIRAVALDEREDNAKRLLKIERMTRP